MVAPSLEAFTEAVADAVPVVDRKTTGQYGDGLGSEDEERQVELLLDHLRETDDRYGDDDPETVEALPEQYTAAEIDEKVAHDIEHWYEIDTNVCHIAGFDGLRYNVHRQDAVISWIVE